MEKIFISRGFDETMILVHENLDQNYHFIKTHAK